MTPEVRQQTKELFKSKDVRSYLAECTIVSTCDANIDIEGTIPSSGDTIRGINRGILLLLNQILEEE